MSPFLFQGAPKPIAIEPCSGNKAAVLTVFLCLPRGSSGVPPPGQSGKACAGEHYICPSAMQSVWTIARVQNNAQHMKARSCSVKRCLVWAQCLMTNFHLEFDVVSHIKSPVGKRGWCAYILLQEASKRVPLHTSFFAEQNIFMCDHFYSLSSCAVNDSVKGTPVSILTWVHI